MAVPAPKSLHRPVLELVSNSETGLAYPILFDRVADHFSLTEEDRQIPLPGYRHPMLLQNLYTAVNQMRKGELLLPPDRSRVIQVSEKGRELLGGNAPALETIDDDLGDMSPEQRMSLGYEEHFEELLAHRQFLSASVSVSYLTDPYLLG